MASAKRQTREEEQPGNRTQSSVTVIKIDRSDLARDPFRYVSDPPRLPKEPRTTADSDKE